jgi:glycosidase
VRGAMRTPILLAGGLVVAAALSCSPAPDASLTSASAATSTLPPNACAALPPSDFRSESIYFALTTRFFDGDSSNNYYNRDRLVMGDPTWRGDFKGLIEQLPYIHDDLGFTALWITPVVVNRSGLDYHGYHGYDFTKVDPRLESPGATFQDLVCAAHAKGVRVVLDVVFNHTSNYGLRGQVHNLRAPIKYFKQSGAFPSANPAYPYQGNLGDYTSANREDDDNPLAPDIFRAADPQAQLAVACPLDGQTIPPSGFSGPNNHNPNHFFSIDPGRLDPKWYHQDGFIAGGDWESTYPLQHKHIAGDCIDLATENPDVQSYLIDTYSKYLDMGVDALRVDTVKHIPRADLLAIVNGLKAHKPGLFVFGENLVKGTGWGTCRDQSDNGPAEIRPWYYTRTTTDPCGGGHDDSGFSVLDFSLFSTFRDNLSQGSFSGLGAVFGNDGLYGDATKLVTFLDNHDVGPQNDWKYRFNGSDEALAAALNLLWTARGIPALFYGTEIRFKAGLEIDGNDSPHDNSGRAYFGDNLLPANIDATRNHKFARHVKRLNLIRQASAALQKGTMESYGENGGTVWYARDYNNGQAYAVVGLAQASGGTISVPGVRGGTYRDAVTGGTITVPPGGTLTFDVKGSSAEVWILDGPGKVGTDGDYLR